MAEVEFDDELKGWLIEVRRRFHRIPELGGSEHRTQRTILELLRDLGIEGRPIAGTGVIARIQGGGPGRTIALRADMDALNIKEEETALNKDYISQSDGQMHACGHDGHMAMVLGAAKVLGSMRDSLEGDVVLIFQPSEEQPPGGAERVIREGGLDGVDAILGIHIIGHIDVGALHFRAGPMMAYHCSYDLTVRGKGGHHMNPLECVDPIVITSRFITSIERDLANAIDPTHPYVIGFGTIEGGTQFNQTPDEVTLIGTFRTFDEEDARTIEDVMRRSLQGLMDGHKMSEDVPSFELEVEPGYPVLVNDHGFTKRATEVLREHFDEVNSEADLNFGAEDFAFYLREVPGMFAFLGTRNPGKGIVNVNHSSGFDIDEDILPMGVSLFTLLARDMLSNPGSYIQD
jgi:amidohydrolase